MLQQLNYIENVIIIISIISKWGKIWKSFGENKSKEEVKHYPAVQKQAHYRQWSSHCTALQSENNNRGDEGFMKKSVP